MILLALAAVLGLPQVCDAPRVLDGDTIACGSVRIRLTGIDAPELPGHCRIGRDCAPGDPFKSRSDLQNGVASGAVTYRAIKVDLYGRTVAMVYAGSVNLNCRQLATARYVAKWDTGHFVKRECGL